MGIGDWGLLIIPSILSRLLRLLGLICRQHLDTYAVGLNILAIYFDGRRADGERTLFGRHERVGVGLLEGRGAFTVDEGRTAAGTRVRTGQHIEIRELGCTQVTTTLIDGVRQLERPTGDHLFRGVRPKNDLIGKRTQCDADKAQYYQ